MEEKSRLAYQAKVERYLESNGIYDFFEELMVDVIYEKPIDIVEYLISRIERGPVRRVFILGPTGTRKRDVAQELGKALGIPVITTASAIQAEIENKNSTLGKIFTDSFAAGTFIRDDAIAKAVVERIEETEKEKTGYVLVGYPRTRNQAISLQKAWIVPTAVLVQELTNEVRDFAINQGQVRLYQQQSVNTGLRQSSSQSKILKDKEARQASVQTFHEFEQNLDDVREVYQSLVYNIPVTGVSFLEARIKGDVDISTCLEVLNLSSLSNAPRQPPGIALLGTQNRVAEAIAERYGLVYVSFTALVADSLHREQDFSDTVRRAQEAGKPLPSSIATAIVKARLLQIDSMVKGWVLDGYPRTLEEATLLEAADVTISQAVYFASPEDVIDSGAKQGFETTYGARLVEIPVGLAENATLEVIDRAVHSKISQS